MAQGGEGLMIARTTMSAIKGYMVDRMKCPGRAGRFGTLAGPRVFKDRFSALSEDELPAAMLYAAEETSEFLDVTEDRRHLKIKIEIQVRWDDADAQLDVLADQIVDCFRNDEYLGGPTHGLVEWCRYTHGELYYDEKRHFNGLCWVLDFDVRYIAQTAPDLAESHIAPFESMGVAYAEASALQPVDNVILAESEIDIPQS